MILLCFMILTVQYVAGFCPAVHTTRGTRTGLLPANFGITSSLLNSNSDIDLEQPKRNQNRPELPEIPGDYDWDAKYAGDADWKTDAVPGKIVLNEIELARQATALAALEEKWRQKRIEEEYEASKNVGWVPTAELANGRTAMFFLVTGLLTEYWTGVSLPGQVEELLRIAGVIGFDG